MIRYALIHAFRLIAKDKALPFEPLVPNEETVEAMKAARRGELVTVDSTEALFANEDEQ